jgi:hypothetical protein
LIRAKNTMNVKPFQPFGSEQKLTCCVICCLISLSSFKVFLSASPVLGDTLFALKKQGKHWDY